MAPTKLLTVPILYVKMRSYDETHPLYFFNHSSGFIR